MNVGGKYNWKGQPERLVYIGCNWSGNGYWHQFEKVGEPGVVWCEVVGADLAHFEESEPAPASPLPEAAEPVAWQVRCRMHPKWRELPAHEVAEYQKHGWEIRALYAAPLPVTQAPAQAGEVAEEAKRLMVNYCHAILNCGERATDQNVKAVVSAENAVYAVIDRLAALATQPLAAPESIGWAAFDTRENRMRTRCETLEQIEAYIQQQHQSRDDITLYKRPIFAGDRS